MRTKVITVLVVLSVIGLLYLSYIKGESDGYMRGYKECKQVYNVE